MTYTITGISLAAAAGLNAFIPLLVLALADRITTEVALSRPFNVISTTGGIVVLLTLLTIDLILDKLPKLEHVNDLLNSAIRPAAGAFLLMAITDGRGEVSIVVAMLLGLLIAGAVHAAKAMARIRMSSTTDGLMNPFVSLAEDGISALLTLLAIAVPWVGLGFLAVSGFGLAWIYRIVPNSKRTRKGGPESTQEPNEVAVAGIADPEGNVHRG